MPEYLDCWQRFLTWKHETLARLAADLVHNNLRNEERIKLLEQRIAELEAAQRSRMPGVVFKQR